MLEGWETEGNLLRVSGTCSHMESIFCDALERLLEGRRLVAWSGFAYKDDIVPHDEIVPLLPYFRGDFEGGSAARLAFAKVVKRMYRIMPDEEFQEVPIALADLPPPGELRRRSRNWQVRGPHVVLRSLLEKRRAEGKDDVAIVRVEQLSPFPFDKVAENVRKVRYRDTL